MTTKELKLWEGEFGDDYITRNQITNDTIEARANLWTNILNVVYTGTFIPTPLSLNVLEIGAGNGTNLLAIDDIFKKAITNGASINYNLIAVEPNEKAKKVLKQQDINNLEIIGDNAFNILAKNHVFDISFTSGVLIHINPKDLLPAMKEIYRVTKKTIICIEYFSPELRLEKYQNKDELMWLNDYGSIWLDNFPLRCLGFGFAWKKLTKLDNVTWQVFEKVN